MIGFYAHDALAEEELSRRKGYSAQPEHVTPTPTVTAGMAAVGSAEGTPSVPLVSPSSKSPEQHKPSPSPVLQQTHGGSPSGPALQPQQVASPISSQHPPDDPPPPQPEDTGAQEPLSLHPPPPQPEDTGVQEPLSPHPHSPGPENTEFTPTAASPTVNPGHLERTPPPAGVFTFTGTSAFVTPATLQYFQTISAGPCWVEMVISYLRLEEFTVSKVVCIFRTQFIFH